MEIKVSTLDKCCPTCPYLEIEAVRLYAGKEVASVYFKCQNLEMCEQLAEMLRGKANED